MSDDQFSIIEDVVADQTIQELCYFNAKRFGLAAELFHSFGKAVRSFDVSAVQRFDELHVMISGNAEGLSSMNKTGNETKNLHSTRATIYKVTDKDELASVRREDRICLFLLSDRVAELRHQFEQFIETAMNVADNIEGAA